MKYTITLLAILTLVSCKKKYTCTCSKKNGTVFTESTWKGTTKEKVTFQKACDDQTMGYIVKYPLDTPTCILK